MTLVERLRDSAGKVMKGVPRNQLLDAANEIERLQALVREMLELADNWPGVAYTYDLESRARSALEPSSHDARKV